MGKMLYLDTFIEYFAKFSVDDFRHSVWKNHLDTLINSKLVVIDLQTNEQKNVTNFAVLVHH